MKQTQPTPIERLMADKQRLETACRQQEGKINESFTYLQANATSLLLSGLTSLIFPTKKTDATQPIAAATAEEAPKRTEGVGLQLSDYLSIAKSLMPVAWQIAKPMAINLCIRLIRKKIGKLFTKDKNKQKK